jgi:hypothetical protein
VFLLDKVRRNLTGTDFTQIRRDVRRAHRSLLKWQFSEAFELIDRIECALGDLPSSLARRVRAETNVLRAMAAALQDDSLSALHIVLMVLRNNDVSPGARLGNQSGHGQPRLGGGAAHFESSKAPCRARDDPTRRARG